MIRAVTFDAAGTLFAPREPVGVTYARAAARFGIGADAAAVDARFRAALRAAPPLAFPDADPAALLQLERDWWRAVVRAALGAGATGPGFESCFEALFDHYAGADAWQVFPDVEDALRTLRERGLRLGVVSNFDGRLPGVLDALGLAPRFDAVVWSSALGAAKPSRRAFEAVAHRLGVALPVLCHVGDDREIDVAGARDAGARALHLDRTATTRDGLASLSELGERLRALG